MSFIKDERGISEEFTSLPALTVVMIGFAIFFVLIANVYSAYNERVESIDKHEASNFVLEKIMSADGYLAKEGIVREGGIIDASKFNETKGDEKRISEIIEKSGIKGIEFGLKLKYEGCKEQLEWCNIPSSKDTAAASKQVAVYINEAKTVPGVLTVLVWEV